MFDAAVLDPDPAEVQDAMAWWLQRPLPDTLLLLDDWLPGAVLLGDAPALSDPPAAGLVGVLQDSLQRLHDLPDGDVVAVAGAAQRIMNWAQAAQLRAVGELHTRYATPEAGASAAAGRLRQDFAPGEVEQDIALACGISEYAAAERLRLALTLDERLPGTRAAAGRGELDFPKLRAIADAVHSLPDVAARAVERQVLPTAAQLSPPRLRRALQRAVIAADPDSADRRAAAAVADRRMACTPGPDGMGELWARVSAGQLLAAEAAVNAAARAAKTPADTRTADQRRADTLIDLITGTTHAPPTPQIVVTVPASTLFAGGTTPGDLTGYGPIPPQLARDLAQHGAWRCAAVDAHATLLGLGASTYTPNYRPGPALRRFVQTRDQHCAAPGCNARADRGDLDHRTPHPEGPTCDCNLQALCRKHHRRKHNGSLRSRASTDPTDPPGTLTWTTRAGLEYKRPPTRLAAGLPDDPRPP